MTDIVRLLLGAALAGVLVGFWLGWDAHKKYMRWPAHPRYAAQIDETTTLHIHYLGKLGEGNAKLFALKVLGGTPLVARYFERRFHEGGFLSHKEYKEVVDELVRRGGARLLPGNRTAITPPGLAICRHIAGRSKQATSKQNSKRMK